MRGRALGLAVAFAAAAVLAAGCGGGSSSSASGKATAAHRAANADVTVRTADCNVWLVLGKRDRTDLLAALRRIFGAQVSGTAGEGPVLSDARATALFDNECAPTFAHAFKLYKLYGRAAAFTGGG